MVARKIVGVTLVLAALGSPARARTARLMGAVESVTQMSLEVVTKDEGTKAVQLDERTQYMRWVTHQPWQQSQRADFTFLSVGRCVNVELRSGGTDQAKTVWVSTDPIGSIYDPCHAFRGRSK